jgi:hypothetical protein
LAKNNTMNSTIIVPVHHINKTLSELKRVGRWGSECVVLWLGRRCADSIQVEEVWVPEQKAGRCFFHIPENAMAKLFKELCARRLMIAAQIHTHPGRAFHSEADDKWAIVRHAGALSLVIPYFARNTRLESFKDDTAVFALSVQNHWELVSRESAEKHYRIIL